MLPLTYLDTDPLRTMLDGGATSPSSVCSREVHVMMTLFLAEGGMLSQDQVITLYNLQRGNVRPDPDMWRTVQKDTDERLVLDVVMRRTAEHWYPRWQFIDEGEAIPALVEIFQFMRERADGWETVAFMLTPNTFLDHARPLDLLRQAQPEVSKVKGALQAQWAEGGG